MGSRAHPLFSDPPNLAGLRHKGFLGNARGKEKKCQETWKALPCLSTSGVSRGLGWGLRVTVPSPRWGSPECSSP